LPRLKIALLLLSPLAAGLGALFVGAYGMAPGAVLGAFADALSGRSGTEAAIILDIRLPRVLLAGLVGMALAGSGTCLQAVFRNPLVDPFILGISAGAAFGCALGIGFLPQVPLVVLAFACAGLAVAVACGLGGAGGDSRLTLVLAGVVVSALFTAGVSLVKVLVDPQRLQSIVFWLMGSFALARWQHVAAAAAAVAVGLGPVLLVRWRLNALSLGDDEARSLGVDAGRLRLALIVLTTLATAVAVSVSGIIGWVGLMVPHLVRMGAGPDHRRLLPLALAGGAAFMIAADTLARSLAVWEVPVGIITALTGAPFFILLIRRGREAWGR
jgi:iron complex transport system permease protein